MALLVSKISKLGNKMIGSKDTTPIGRARFVHKVTKSAMIASKMETLSEAFK